MLRSFAKLLTKSFLFALIFTSVFLLVLVMYLVSKNNTYKNKIYPHVMINGHDFSGKGRSDVEAFFVPKNKKLSEIIITLRYEEDIATFSGSLLNIHYDSNSIYEHAYDIGRSGSTENKLYQRVVTLLDVRSYTFLYKPLYNEKPIKDYLLQLDEYYSIEPQNALFEIKDGKVTAFKMEKDGLKVDVESSLKGIQETLHNIESIDAAGVTIHINPVVLKPDITMEKANNLGIVEIISEGVSDYTGSSFERAHNVRLAASRLHGVIIPPGEVFSFNNAVGEVSTATGYKSAYIIKDGKTILGDGGGVCQDSTTMFRAALNAGLPIVKRSAHAYRVRYYENDRKPGFDATVYAPSVDFQFLNDTPAHILIQSKYSTVNNMLVFELYGTSDGRVVELSDSIITGIIPAPEPKYIDDPTLPPGTTKQTDWAATGAKAQFSYKVTSASGEVLQDTVFYSNYRAWQAVFLVGPH